MVELRAMNELLYIKLIHNLIKKGGVIRVYQDQERMMKGEEVIRLCNNR